MSLNRLGLAVSIAATLSVADAAEITNVVAKGNLASSHSVGCVDISTLSSEHTPADTFRGMAKCLSEENYSAAVAMYALSRVYGAVDVRRVADKTAHQAIKVLQIEAANNLPEEELGRFREAAKASLASGSESLKSICTRISTLGAPTYYPAYMIQHGMGAFGATDNSKVIDQTVDVKSVFEETLEKILHCSDN